MESWSSMQMGIRTFHSNGSGMQLIIPYDQNSDHLIYSPSWSPDGSKIAVLSYKMNSDIAVVLFDPNGTNADTVVRYLPPGMGLGLVKTMSFHCAGPQMDSDCIYKTWWSQDGEWITYLCYKTDHTSLRQVTFSPGVTDMSLHGVIDARTFLSGQI